MEANTGPSYLPASRVQFTNEALGWREAIRMAAKPMVDQGLITEAYVDATISIAEEKGPFFDLGKGIAMPHARPEAGASALGLSFLRCHQPVNLLDLEDRPIEIFFMLSATDPNTHLEMLQRLATVLIDDDKVAQLKAATTADEVLSVFNEPA